MARRSKNTAKDSMVEKITIERSSNRRSVTSMIVGTTLISLGVLMLVVGVVLFFLYRAAPKVDKALAVPTIEKLPSATNSKTLTIKGKAEGNRVMFFVNDQIVEDNLKVVDGKFTYEYELTVEGDYRIQAAAVQGFPVRVRSDKSAAMIVALDLTAPSSDVTLRYSKETTSSAFTLKGTIDPNTTIVLSKGNKKYIAKSDSEGVFRLKNIPVKRGDNEFDVELRDAAGNVTRLDKDVVVAMVVDGINGDGVSDLPESAGNLSDALAQLTGNRLMMTFGLIALTILIANSAVVISKIRSEKVA